MRCIMDCEANGLLETVTKLHCAVFKDIDSLKVYKFFPPIHLNSLFKFMDNCSLIIGHNIYRYDFPMLKKLFHYEHKGNKLDTLVLSRLMNPNFVNPPGYTGMAPHSVEAWGYRVGRGKPEHEDWENYSEEMLHRCSEDVEIQHLVYLWLMKQSEREGWGEACKLTNKLFEILALQEEAGWKVDKEHMLKSIAWLEKWIDKIATLLSPMLPSLYEVQEQKEKGEYKFVKKPFLKDGNYSQHTLDWMVAIGLDPADRPVGGPYTRVYFRKVSLNSNDETKQMLLNLGWIPQEWNMNKKTGERTSPKLSKDDPFIGVSGSMGKLIARRVQARQRLAILQGWLEGIREDGTLPGVVTGIASTGRMKHSVIVNVPGEESFFGKWMRRCFIARDGYVLVGVDAAGCQNRMLAARVGDDAFTHTLIHGRKEDKTSIHYVNQKAVKEYAGYDISYHDIKTENYAFMFGASDHKLGKIINKDANAGAKIREAFLNVVPGFAKLLENLTTEWRSTAKRRLNRWGKMEYYDGKVRGLDGRPIFISSENKLLVFMLQSDEAIMMSAAYCFLYKRLINAGFKWGDDFRIVLFYHDEYEIECREEIAERVKSIGEQCIVDAGRYYKIACPQEGDGKIGKNWMDIH